MARIAIGVLGLLAAIAIFAAMLMWGVMLSRNNPKIHPTLIFVTLSTLYTLIILLGLSRWAKR